MPPPTQFPTGTFAVTRSPLMLVRVVAQKGAKVTLTRILYLDEKPLEGKVEEENLMTLKQFEAWAPSQPWFRPPQPAHSLPEVLNRIRAIVQPA